MVDTASQFGAELKRRRRALGLTQVEVADTVGCSEITIRMLEAGQRRPSRQLASLLARRLNIEGPDLDNFLRLARLREFDPVEAAAPDVAGEAPPSQGQVQHNLPALLSPLIGREHDAHEVTARLLRPNVRLLTLSGPPGVGKTSLAVQVATSLLDHFPDGVVFAPLAPVTDPQLFAPTIARALKLKDDPSTPPLAAVEQYLQDKRVLLILDNFEQIIAAAPQVAALVAACENLKVLVTSREVLRVRGEHHYNVLPLPTPDLSALTTPGELARNPSVALFIERAPLANPDFTLTSGNAQDVAAICAALEGLPLAIELVVPRIRLMSPRTLLVRLRGIQPPDTPSASPMLRSEPFSNLNILSGGARDLPARHQTLRAAIGWSYDLLSEDERALFRRLGVFVGGFSLPAAEAVCNAHATLSTDMLQGISSLLDKNLLKRVEVEGADVDPRFTMLETIREYALERLEESEESESIRRVHAEYYLAIAEASMPNIMGMGDQVWLDRLEQEIDNFRAALGWAIEDREAEMALSLAGALGFFFEIRSYFTEGINWLSRALAIYAEQQDQLAPEGGERNPSTAHARALWARGRLRFFTSEDVSARQDYQESLDVYRELNDKWGMSATHVGLGQHHMNSGDYETAYKHMEESLALRREMGYKIGEANSLWTIGLVLGYVGEYDKGIASLEQALDLARQLGSKYVLSGATRDLGEVLALKGDYERSAVLYNDSIPRFRELRDPEALMWALIGLGYVRLRQGDRPEAEELFRESLEIMRELGTHKRISLALEGMAQIAVERAVEEEASDHIRRQAWLVYAARLLGATESRAAIGRSPLPLFRRAEHERLVARASRLTGESFEREFEAGKSLSLHDMVHYALQSPS